MHYQSHGVTQFGPLPRCFEKLEGFQRTAVSGRKPSRVQLHSVTEPDKTHNCMKRLIFLSRTYVFSFLVSYFPFR